VTNYQCFNPLGLIRDFSRTNKSNAGQQRYIYKAGIFYLDPTLTLKPDQNPEKNISDPKQCLKPLYYHESIFLNTLEVDVYKKLTKNSWTGFLWVQFPLKGTVARVFWSLVFNQSTPYGWLIPNTIFSKFGFDFAKILKFESHSAGSDTSRTKKS
jgi:hypothetical protein